MKTSTSSGLCSVVLSPSHTRVLSGCQNEREMRFQILLVSALRFHCRFGAALFWCKICNISASSPVTHRVRRKDETCCVESNPGLIIGPAKVLAHFLHLLFYSSESTSCRWGISPLPPASPICQLSARSIQLRTPHQHHQQPPVPAYALLLTNTTSPPDIHAVVHLPRGGLRVERRGFNRAVVP